MQREFVGWFTHMDKGALSVISPTVLLLMATLSTYLYASVNVALHPSFRSGLHTLCHDTTYRCEDTRECVLSAVKGSDDETPHHHRSELRKRLPYSVISRGALQKEFAIQCL